MNLPGGHHNKTVHSSTKQPTTLIAKHIKHIGQAALPIYQAVPNIYQAPTMNGRLSHTACNDDGDGDGAVATCSACLSVAPSVWGDTSLHAAP